MVLKKEEYFAKVFMGCSYELPDNVKTVGDFKSWLEKIIEDLPEDNNLEISDLEVQSRQGKKEIYYLLKKGFTVE